MFSPENYTIKQAKIKSFSPALFFSIHILSLFCLKIFSMQTKHSPLGSSFQKYDTILPHSGKLELTHNPPQPVHSDSDFLPAQSPLASSNCHKFFLMRILNIIAKDITLIYNNLKCIEWFREECICFYEIYQRDSDKPIVGKLSGLL